MSSSTKMTLRGSVFFGAITIAVAVFFVGAEGEDSALSETFYVGANSDDGAAEAIPEAPEQSANKEMVESDTIEDEELDWGEDSLTDDTQGFDPTPIDDQGFADSGDEAIESYDTDAVVDVYTEVDSSSEPQAGNRVPGL